MEPNTVKDRCIYTWKENNGLIDCNEISAQNNGFCDNHQACVDYYDLYMKDNKNYVINEINRMLGECENTRGKDNKKKIAIELLDFLVKHKYFVFQHKNFKNTILKKLHKFDGDIDSQKYINLLFSPVCIEQCNDDVDDGIPTICIEI